jgi:NAD(P)-dependent dehydrogenase (short-subunit alcohol dehydrogenase family)
MFSSNSHPGLTCLAYNTSKSALLQMCRSAAAEWGQYGIRVNVSPSTIYWVLLSSSFATFRLTLQTLSPGYIRTSMTDELLEKRPDLKEEWLSGSMLNRLSTPDEFRGPVLYLLSQASSFMTGGDLIVDGGHTAY